MNLISDYAIDETFGNGHLELVNSDGAFLMVYMEDLGSPTFFIITNYSISELKEIELVEHDDYGLIVFNVGFDSKTKFTDGDYYDIFDDNSQKLGTKLSYKVTLDNLKALKSTIRERNTRVLSYSCSDMGKLENQFYRWFYTNFKSDIVELSKSSDVFTKKENYKDLVTSTIRIAADNILEKNILTFWDAVDVERCVENPSDIEKDFKDILKLNEVKDFIPVLF
jgi:hypothetical protein